MELGLTFGAVGDFISIAILIKDSVSAFDGSRGSSKAYSDLVGSLNVIDQARQEADRIYCGLPENDELRITAQDTAHRIRHCLLKIEYDIKKYQLSLGHGGSGSALKDAARKIQWRLVDEKDIEKFRFQLMVYCQSLGMLLGPIKLSVYQCDSLPCTPLTDLSLKPSISAEPPRRDRRPLLP